MSAQIYAIASNSVKPPSAKHAAAREHAQSGRRTFPCWPRTKIPATPNGFRDATTDLGQIDAWWSENPEFNPAYCPGDHGECVAVKWPARHASSSRSAVAPIHSTRPMQSGAHAMVVLVDFADIRVLLVPWCSGLASALTDAGPPAVWRAPCLSYKNLSERLRMGEQRAPSTCPIAANIYS
jgi:hypothetical protein